MGSPAAVGFGPNAGVEADGFAEGLAVVTFDVVDRGLEARGVLRAAAGFVATGFAVAGFAAAGFAVTGFATAGFAAAGFAAAFAAAGFAAAGFAAAAFAAAGFAAAGFDAARFDSGARGAVWREAGVRGVEDFRTRGACAEGVIRGSASLLEGDAAAAALGFSSDSESTS